MSKQRELDRLQIVSEITRVAHDVMVAYLNTQGITQLPTTAEGRERAHQFTAEALANKDATAMELYESHRERLIGVRNIPAWGEISDHKRVQAALHLAVVRSLYPQ